MFPLKWHSDVGRDLYYDIHLRERGYILELEEPPRGRGTHHGLPGIPSLSEASAPRPLDRGPQRLCLRRALADERGRDQGAPGGGRHPREQLGNPTAKDTRQQV